MQERNITITLEKAKEWYNSDNTTLKEIALQAFSEEKLQEFDFTEIKSFFDVMRYLYDYNYKEYKDVLETIKRIKEVSNASAAMFKVNLTRKVLNTGYNMHLTKNAKNQDYTWYPYFRFITENSTCFNFELKSGILEKIGKITNEGVTYDVLGGNASMGLHHGLGDYYTGNNVGIISTDVGFLGCATQKIAEHFGKYFGMLIIEAMYGDLVEFKRENNIN